MANEMVLIRGERHVVTQCGTCAVWHTVPEIVYDCHRREGGFHTCPNGHLRGWQTGTEQKAQEEIRRERNLLKQDAARLEDEARQARQRAEQAEAATKRLQKRVSAGVCPCCNRTFTNMARHMKTKHPNVVPLEKKKA